MLYHVGDFVLCRISDDESTIFDVDYYDKRYKHLRAKYFEVVAVHKDKYIILAEHVKGEFIIKLDKDICSELNINNSYLNKKAYAVREKAVGGRKIIDYYRDAIRCNICNDWAPYAVPNYPKNIFICYTCRHDPRQIFKIEKLLNG